MSDDIPVWGHERQVLFWLKHTCFLNLGFSFSSTRFCPSTATPSCHTRSFMFHHILTMCDFEITSRKRSWILPTFVNTLKRPASAERGGPSSRERSSSYCSPSASTSTKGKLWPVFLWVAYILFWKYSGLNHRWASLLFEPVGSRWGLLFFFLKKCNLKLLHVAIVPLQSSECYDVHGAVFRREVLPSPLMSGWNYISCEIGLIVPFTGIHLCHCNYIKFWERVYNWCDKAV